MGLLAPPIYIAPPATDPHRFGLFSVANMPDPTDRWEFGVEWEPIAGERAHLRAHECVDEYTADVVPRDGEDSVEGIPFVVVGSYSCSSAARPLEEAEERARLHLSAGAERAVEYAIATGVMGNLPSFQGATDLTDVPGTGDELGYALGRIESQLAQDLASVGTIHATRQLGSALGAGQYAWRQGQRLETLLGSYVVAGGGYDLANIGPAGEAPAAGSAWLYGTGRPTIRQSEVYVQPDDSHFLNRDDNLVTILAQRTYLVTWEGPTVAVLVDLPGA